MLQTVGEPHSPKPVMSPAASNLAGQFRRPRLAGELIAIVIAGLDLTSISLLLWFSQYALVPPAAFHPFVAGVLAVILAGGGLGIMVPLSIYRLRVLVDLKKQALRLALILLPVNCAGLSMFVPGTPGLMSSFVAALGILGAVLFLRWLLIVPFVRWAVDSGLTERRAVLLGGGDPARDLIAGLHARGDDIRICAIFDDRRGDRSPDLVLDVPKIGRFDDLLAFARGAEIDMVIIALPLEATERIEMLLDKFRVLPLPVHLAQYSSDYAFDKGAMAPGNAKLDLLAHESFGMRRRMLKRIFDITIAAIAVTVLAPLLALIALAIRLDSPGPVFFRQMRCGFNERQVPVLKFRSMRADKCDATARNIVTKGDPRVTRVGAFLRKSSLDELPQLFNVLKGDLSLVGPRPHAVDAVTGRKEAFADLVAGYSARHRLPPGITGWAQIHGWRGGIDDPEALRSRVSYDLWYIENWSLWLDLRILIATPLSLFNTKNAY